MPKLSSKVVDALVQLRRWLEVVMFFSLSCFCYSRTKVFFVCKSTECFAALWQVLNYCHSLLLYHETSHTSCGFGLCFRKWLRSWRRVNISTLSLVCPSTAALRASGRVWQPGLFSTKCTHPTWDGWSKFQESSKWSKTLLRPTVKQFLSKMYTF